MNPPQPYEAILALLETYFEGLYRADSAMLATVFHPHAQYVSAMPEDYRALSFPEYRQVLDQRVPPANTGETRKERIISIETGGNTLAFAKVEMTMMGREYTDFLTLVFDHGRWAIMAKIFYYEMTNQGD
ncbi:nuclear transport factor 2 family protein [Marinobacter sp. 71-i]|uniref:Nuclear transport factor 2 family protein n=1 Tax=Marinobacter iranensis TaxID=2962607 RepID=A0ABT5YB85_9GAMM|nr:nuclear transport factor 2 family protein [Marinobacter iranensis]MDF0750946.1 nuclear transport factor 2 family protein [Marinobacter iranensis]